MDIEVILPQEGMAMQAGTVVEWLKGIGDAVEKGEPIVEVEAEKVTFEVVSPASGTLTEIKVEENVEVPVRTVLGIVTPKEEAA
jgi:pyruvate/2-oxoglutarate dehydrogenase complex dihydrolipoamide acyltransferase (E2) component